MLLTNAPIEKPVELNYLQDHLHTDGSTIRHAFERPRHEAHIAAPCPVSAEKIFHKPHQLLRRRRASPIRSEAKTPPAIGSLSASDGPKNQTRPTTSPFKPIPWSEFIRPRNETNRPYRQHEHEDRKLKVEAATATEEPLRRKDMSRQSTFDLRRDFALAQMLSRTSPDRKVDAHVPEVIKGSRTTSLDRQVSSWLDDLSSGTPSETHGSLDRSLGIFGLQMPHTKALMEHLNGVTVASKSDTVKSTRMFNLEEMLRNTSKSDQMMRETKSDKLTSDQNWPRPSHMRHNPDHGEILPQSLFNHYNGRDYGVQTKLRQSAAKPPDSRFDDLISRLSETRRSAGSGNVRSNPHMPRFAKSCAQYSGDGLSRKRTTQQDLRATVAYETSTTNSSRPAEQFRGNVAVRQSSGRPVHAIDPADRKAPIKKIKIPACFASA